VSGVGGDNHRRRASHTDRGVGVVIEKNDAVGMAGIRGAGVADAQDGRIAGSADGQLRITREYDVFVQVDGPTAYNIKRDGASAARRRGFGAEPDTVCWHRRVPVAWPYGGILTE